MLFSWLPLGQVRASASNRAAALNASRIEDLASPEGAATFIAGGRQTRGALPVTTRHFDAAVYSSRGRGYARYNEDAATLFHDARGWIYASVFDQAGGLGGLVRGEASEIAATEMFEAFRTIARSQDAKLDIGATLHAGVLRAHETLLARQQGEVTTAVAMVAMEGSALLLNSGDSGALHFDAQGRLKDVTAMHEHESPVALGCLTHALGLVPEGPAPDAYVFTLEPGDMLILSSDGLLDAGLTPDEVGRLIAQAVTAEEAVNRLCTRVLRMMSAARAKPDNLTVVGVRARAISP